jgi:hypothetical protein
VSAAVPVRNSAGMRRCAFAIGRTSSSDAAEAAMKTITCTTGPAPSRATTNASSAASATGPRKKSPGVKISPTASARAAIAQITQPGTRRS